MLTTVRFVLFLIYNQQHRQFCLFNHKTLQANRNLNFHLDTSILRVVKKSPTNSHKEKF